MTVVDTRLPLPLTAKVSTAVTDVHSTSARSCALIIPPRSIASTTPAQPAQSGPATFTDSITIQPLSGSQQLIQRLLVQHKAYVSWTCIFVERAGPSHARETPSVLCLGAACGM